MLSIYCWNNVLLQEERTACPGQNAQRAMATNKIGKMRSLQKSIFLSMPPYTFRCSTNPETETFICRTQSLKGNLIIYAFLRPAAGCQETEYKKEKTKVMYSYIRITGATMCQIKADKIIPNEILSVAIHIDNMFLSVGN